MAGSVGYFAYDRDSNNKEIEKLKNQIEKLEQKTNKPDKEDSKEISNAEESIVGYYKSGVWTTYDEEVDSEGCSTESTYEIALYKDGTFDYAYHLGCGGASQSGTYTYNDQEIIRTCDDNSAQCPAGTTEKFIINEDGTLTNPENKIFYKVDKSLIQIID